MGETHHFNPKATYRPGPAGKQHLTYNSPSAKRLQADRPLPIKQGQTRLAVGYRYPGGSSNQYYGYGIPSDTVGLNMQEFSQAAQAQRSASNRRSYSPLPSNRLTAQQNGRDSTLHIAQSDISRQGHAGYESPMDYCGEQTNYRESAHDNRQGRGYEGHSTPAQGQDRHQEEIHYGRQYMNVGNRTAQSNEWQGSSEQLVMDDGEWDERGEERYSGGRRNGDFEAQHSQSSGVSSHRSAQSFSRDPQPHLSPRGQADPPAPSLYQAQARGGPPTNDDASLPPLDNSLLSRRSNKGSYLAGQQDYEHDRSPQPQDGSNTRSPSPADSDSSQTQPVLVAEPGDPTPWAITIPRRNPRATKYIQIRNLANVVLDTVKVGLKNFRYPLHGEIPDVLLLNQATKRLFAYPIKVSLRASVVEPPEEWTSGGVERLVIPSRGRYLKCVGQPKPKNGISSFIDDGPVANDTSSDEDGPIDDDGEDVAIAQDPGSKRIFQQALQGLPLTASMRKDAPVYMAAQQTYLKAKELEVRRQEAVIKGRILDMYRVDPKGTLHLLELLALPPRDISEIMQDEESDIPDEPLESLGGRKTPASRSGNTAGSNDPIDVDDDAFERAEYESDTTSSHNATGRHPSLPGPENAEDSSRHPARQRSASRSSLADEDVEWQPS